MSLLASNAVAFRLMPEAINMISSCAWLPFCLKELQWSVSGYSDTEGTHSLADLSSTSVDHEVVQRTRPCIYASSERIRWISIMHLPKILLAFTKFAYFGQFATFDSSYDCISVRILDTVCFRKHASTFGFFFKLNDCAWLVCGRCTAVL